MNFNNYKTKAFTLIELLVVISILGILSGFIIVNMNGAIDSANDARRKSDLDAIRKTLIVYGTLNGMVHPIQTTTCNIGSNCNNLASALLDITSNLPVDPVSGYYTYISSSTGSNYFLSGNLSSSTLSHSNNGGYAVGPVDIDGNKYGAINIGTQTWMASNLMTTKYNDGTAITRGPTGATWDGADHGYYAYPPAIGNTTEETLTNIQSKRLGFVYQWSASNSGKLCPIGWHVPSDAEFKTLEMYLGMSQAQADAIAWRGTNEGSQLKEAGTTNWGSNAGATNFSVFTILGAGYRGSDGSLSLRSVNAVFWTSTLSDASSAFDRSLYGINTGVNRNFHPFAYAFSVRCLKD